MAADAMTPLQRLAAYAKGEPIDRLPCVPIVGNTAARVIGARVGDFRGNGRLIAEAQVAAYRLFGYDTIRVFTDLYTQAEAMGATVHYPADETAYLEAPAIADPAEIQRLQPADPHRDGNLPHHLEAMRIAVDAVGAEVPVTGAVTCPFTNASFLVGAETLARLMLREPETVHRLCELSLETSIRYAEAIIEAGAIPSLTDAMSSSTVISPRQFREFSYPYLKRLIDFIHGRGKSVTLHICGKTAKIWEAMADAGADCISIDNDASLLDAKREVGEWVRLMGNVHPSAVMLQGTPEDVRQATLDCIRQGHDNPRGYIVASGCSLPTETPFANIRAMLDTVREVGWPVNLA
ncbi:uroporphyrinogen decarboxylase family protein [Geobacter hydrogenophilus]|uniref:Methylcobamide--CoM methyltransferase n=1 Tax=Geobacter hydrogenophilus TaxID=40983 RepID=A0A9W6G2Q8_9BACT|nr:uroporphyrinogen decarboxylase family protein [Geobacter hydrogenophilus]GLI39426.1 methylcobamide--CoM methyltransferase [Geobacter hydrogenophilus]